MDFDAGNFRAALGKFGTGVTIITAKGPDGPVGITVNSFASVSLDPPLVLWSLAKTSKRTPIYQAADHIAIHVVAADQADLCMGFIKNGQAFDPKITSHNDHGLPLIDGCLARFECTANAVHDGGDHLIFVSQVNQVTANDGDPLMFFNSGFGGFTAR